jgi:hypothetical protein
MEFLFAKELFTYCKYVLFVHTIPKVPTEISFGNGMVNTKNYQPIPTGKYQFGIQLYKNDCKDVDLYNTRKRYAVTKSLNLMRNISWLVSCFFKIKKPNKHCSGNQSVNAGVRILT